MTIKSIRLLALIPFILLTSLSAYPDSVRVHNGDVISGQLLTFQEGVCIFKSRYGGIMKIEANEIVALATDKIKKVSLNSGEIIVGRLEINDQGSVVLISETLGRSTITMESIENIQRHFQPKINAEKTKPVQFGEEEKSAPPLEFLTGSTVLLDEGSHQLDFGIDYRQNRDYYALPSVGYFENHSYTARMARFDATLRSGWANGIETFVAIPVTYTYIEQVSSNEYVRDIDEWSLADVTLGIQYELLGESVTRPAVTLSTTVTAPTGEKEYYSLTDDWRDPLNNSTGHWGLATGLTFVRTTDPAILFGGVILNYSFEEDINGYKIEPGEGLSSYMGVGFALNDRLSLGGRFSYSYYANMTVDNEEIHGSSSEAMDLSLSGSYRLSNKWIATPQVTFSLNDDAGAPSISLRFNRSFL